MEFLCISLCFIVGLVMFLRPRLVWELENFWKTKGGEPTQLYLKVNQIFGAVLVILSLIMLVVFARV